MRITQQQARAAAERLRHGSGDREQPTEAPVSPEVLAAAVAVARSTPDTSAQRIADAKTYLAGVPADSRVVASMMIQRIVSDALR